jgi:hypothetical protein
MHHPPAGPERAAHIPQTSNRIGEEHRSETSENEVELIGWQCDLRITSHQANIPQATRFNFLPRDLKKSITAIDAGHFACRTDQTSEFDRRVAKPAAYV